jgi:hypothetical protein
VEKVVKQLARQASLTDFPPPPVKIVTLLANPVTGLLEARVRRRKKGCEKTD